MSNSETKEWQILQGAAYVSLATIRKSGAWVNTAVWAAADDSGVIYVFSERSAGKVKRLINSSRARLAVCDMRGKLLGEWVDAEAHIIDQVADVQIALDALAKKYGWQIKLTNFLSKLSGKYDKRAYIAIRSVANQ